MLTFDDPSRTPSLDHLRLLCLPNPREHSLCGCQLNFFSFALRFKRKMKQVFRLIRWTSDCAPRQTRCTLLCTFPFLFYQPLLTYYKLFFSKDSLDCVSHVRLINGRQSDVLHSLCFNLVTVVTKNDMLSMLARSVCQLCVGILNHILSVGSSEKCKCACLLCTLNVGENVY